MHLLFKAMIEEFGLGDVDERHLRILRAMLDLLEAVAAVTETDFDDWLVARLRRLGVDEDTIRKTFKPERIQED